MAFTESLDQELEAGGTLHDYVGFNCPGGQKPRPLKSSWHMHERIPAKTRPDRVIFFIDTRQGRTVCQADSLELAMACINNLKDRTLVIRPYTITEETLREDERLNKWKNQHSL